MENISSGKARQVKRSKCHGGYDLCKISRCTRFLNSIGKGLTSAAKNTIERGWTES